MIPTVNKILGETLEVKSLPSKDYAMILDRVIISGYNNGKEAMKQTIYKILNTERYQYIIYSWNYGIELLDLFGMPVTYVCPEIERRVKEALMQDDRITGVDEFTFDLSKKGVVHTFFTAHTIFGDIKADREVSI